MRQVVIDNNSVDRFADDSSAYEFVLAAISRGGLEICVSGNDLGRQVLEVPGPTTLVRTPRKL